ncbi:hypothetical protein H4R20_004567 [Coemansia guatemalensis]|uniref:Cytochrome c oxidase assembly factor 3 n=1 Tax=Coemansia guatemalensis TaxID=2761395 RepID=A0A9W8HW00_9FUNG|nr:hypothetical protein H4R20_004567 [Coemansia guatemalensis]
MLIAINSQARGLVGRRVAAAATHGGLRSTLAGGCGQQRSKSGQAPVYNGYRFTDSIERGRQPYAIKNVATAFGLAGLCASVYFYSLYAVKQEDYSDVPMPDMPSQEEKLAIVQASTKQ